MADRWTDRALFLGFAFLTAATVALAAYGIIGVVRSREEARRSAEQEQNLRITTLERRVAELEAEAGDE